MSKPLFVAISDIHFNINNLDIAVKALSAAFDTASELNIPLVIAGDLHDTKAIIRGEVANTLLSMSSYYSEVTTYILTGNHDLLNEKNDETSGLIYLHGDGTTLIDSPQLIDDIGVFAIPYQNTNQRFQDAIQSAPIGSIVVCHQGIKGAFMGDYQQDKTSVTPEITKDFKVISGHYHRHQTIGTVTYIGSPFTHTFGEANDGPKGYLIVKDDGSYEQVVLKLRKHVILELDGVTELTTQLVSQIAPDDLVWVKIKDKKSTLNKVKKSIVATWLGMENFKLDLIATDEVIMPQKAQIITLTPGQIMDKFIDAMDIEVEHSKYLKTTWRGLL
jgi:DNA repair exonuclease SbcCD nuclease subunit